MFTREDYYSQTEACKIFKIRPEKFKELIKAFELDVVKNSITLFTPIEAMPYNVGAIYVKKTDFEIAFEKFENELEKKL
ncbi:hypothetical protein [Pedobacter sp.]|uniref:hypothetical protein n=1 Tax=Pedobacter sp. TaxID=1411316 RepID=UPI003C6938C7